jgi:hypothetical protein
MSGFKFEGLMIENVILHSIYSRTPDKQLVEPKLSTHLIKLQQKALDALQLRITKALGNRSHGIEMSIEQIGDDSFFQNAAAMLHTNEEEFIELSKKLAKNLNKAQFSTNAPGGVLAIIAGRIGGNAVPFIAAIKAEMQDGFKANENDNGVDMEYIEELLLTSTQRLYKIGFLIESVSEPSDSNGYLPKNYLAFLFDHLITSTETSAAAAYFYGAFLGMGIHESAKKLTNDFFEFTKNFINTCSISNDEKLDFYEALRSELRSQDSVDFPL